MIVRIPYRVETPHNRGACRGQYRRHLPDADLFVAHAYMERVERAMMASGIDVYGGGLSSVKHDPGTPEKVQQDNWIDWSIERRLGR